MRDYSSLPPLQNYPLQDGHPHYYRYYPGNSDRAVVIIHGIAEDSKYLDPLARYISGEGLADVYVPDMRGYGQYPGRRGDVDYIGQHDDDLSEWVRWMKEEEGKTSVILAGHSAGGGTVLRMAGTPCASSVDGFLLLAPLVHFLAPTMKSSKGNKSSNKVYTSRLIRLLCLNKLGMRSQNHLPVLDIYKDESAKHGTETLSISYRLFMSRIPDNYKKQLRLLSESTLVIVGSEDEEFEASAFGPLFHKYSKAKTALIDEENHDGILSNEQAFSQIKNWMKQLESEDS